MSQRNGQKVLVAMSGGVDSSVAAALLKSEGYEVVGCFMRLGSEDAAETLGEVCQPDPEKKNHQGCCSLNDASDARLVAAMLDIPFYVLNFKADFGRIIDYFVDEYNAGRTPNPCIRCNDWLKFGKLADYAKSIDAQWVASGHYARVEHGDGQPRLLQGVDGNKDQSYVLFGTPREQLEHMLLPIGEYEKPAVRSLAEEMKLPVFDKPDSQEICFVPNDDYVALVRKQTPHKVQQGDILDVDGKVVGKHDGQQGFTIGQRRGTGVAMGYPIYVTGKNVKNNTITVGPREDLMSLQLTADQSNWLVDVAVGQARRCLVKIRYNSQPVAGLVTVTGDDTLKVVFDEFQSAVTPGQAVVCYEADRLLGGGWIDTATR